MIWVGKRHMKPLEQLKWRRHVPQAAIKYRLTIGWEIGPLSDLYPWCRYCRKSLQQKLGHGVCYSWKPTVFDERLADRSLAEKRTLTGSPSI
jgi:hypothetical protein